MILDGYGLNDRTDGNAVAQAKTPVMDQLMKEYPFVKGNASGLAVGLPDFSATFSIIFLSHNFLTSASPANPPSSPYPKSYSGGRGRAGGA